MAVAVYYEWGGMAGRNGQELLSTWVPADVAQAFKATARAEQGGTSAALRRLVVEAVQGAPPRAPAGAGTGQQVGVRLKPVERAALAEAARSHGTSPASWLRSLAIVRLAGKPQWSPAELEELREVFRELRRIGSNVNQIARALNVAVQSGVYPPHQGIAAERAAESIRDDMRRVVGMMTGNFDYWGLPFDERPRPDPRAVEKADAAARAAEEQRRARPRRRPGRFAEDGA